jgi:transmembrane sensor
MNYVDFDVSDFLEDEGFKNWIYAPTEETNEAWRRFLAANPQKSEIVNNAKTILRVLAKEAENNMPKEEVVDDMWENILDRTTPIVAQPSKTSRIWISVLSAAAATVVLVIGWMYRPQQPSSLITYSSNINKSDVALNEIKNTTSHTILIQLDDSSTVLLQPKSNLSYPKNFDQKKSREVYLSGEGFFKITKNPERPFIVYANEVITRVLGTSFTVKAFDDASEIEVEVKTGKVSVFTVGQDIKNGDDQFSPSRAVIITPNQKITYSRSNEILKKWIIEAPGMIPSDFATPPIQDFEDKKVADIFTNLEKAYEIEIEYDHERLGDCLLTASFTNESLYDKIDLICKGIEAEYKVENGKIIVFGRGCR